MAAVRETDLPFPRRSGKVRDCYDLGDRLLIVSTDRISAFDFILQPAIPDKGIVLTKLSEFWFGRLPVEHHFLAAGLPESVSGTAAAAGLAPRSMLVRKAEVIPFECVVRGYLEGSGWREYQQTQSVCGIQLPAGLQQCSRLDEPIFTPATKVDEGHDENVAFDRMRRDLGDDIATRLRELSLTIYNFAAMEAERRGLILADTKFEFGWSEGRLLLIDEVLTPDSSRYWDASHYEPGRSQPSFDKQFVREYLMNCGWERQSPPPPLPEHIVAATRQRYITAYERLTGQPFTA